jgi:hypothetical protein
LGPPIPGAIGGDETATFVGLSTLTADPRAHGGAYNSWSSTDFSLWIGVLITTPPNSGRTDDAPNVCASVQLLPAIGADAPAST